MAVDDVATYGVICEGVEILSNVMIQCHCIEALQESGNSTAVIQRNECLVVLYVSVLTYLAKAKKFYSQTAISEPTKLHLNLN